MDLGETRLFKILGGAAWAARKAHLPWAEVDRHDGFVHLSTSVQVKETASKHFAGRADLMLVEVDGAALGDSLRWEASRGGDLFPHVYGDVPLSAVRGTWPLPWDGARHRFPTEVIGAST